MLSPAQPSALTDDVFTATAPVLNQVWLDEAMLATVPAGTPTTDVASSPRGWGSLQAELLVSVLEMCTPIEATRVSSVCRAWNTAASSNALWAQFAKRRFNAATAPRASHKSRIRADERKNWKSAFRDWHVTAQMPRGAFVSRHAVRFASGSQIVRASGFETDSCPVGLALSVWMVVAHSADVRLRPTPPAAARAMLGHPEPARSATTGAASIPAGDSATPLGRLAGRHWLRVRLLVQNAVRAGTRCASDRAADPTSTFVPGRATPPNRTRSSRPKPLRQCPEQSWPLAPVLVSAAGICFRLKDGSSVPCLPLSGPAVVALNGQALKGGRHQPASVGETSPDAAGMESEAAAAAGVSQVAAAASLAASGATDAVAGTASSGGAGVVGLAVSATLPAAASMPWLHSCAGGGCACGFGNLEIAATKGLLDWKVQDTGVAAPSMATAVLRADEFAVLDVWAPFDDDVLFEPEALERCLRLEVPVRRADGVGQSTTIRAPVLPDRGIWEQYQYLAGGGMCLKSSES